MGSNNIHIPNSVADPGFPVGAPTPKAATFRKICMSKRKNLDPCGARAGGAPPDPPMQLLFRGLLKEYDLFLLFDILLYNFILVEFKLLNFIFPECKHLCCNLINKY